MSDETLRYTLKSHAQNALGQAEDFPHSLAKIDFHGTDHVSITNGQINLAIDLGPHQSPAGFYKDITVANPQTRHAGYLDESNPNLVYASSDDFIVLAGILSDQPDQIALQTQESYHAIFNFLSQRGYTNILRGWNFIPQINEADPHGIENYQAFCKGRALAFEHSPFSTQHMPAATGIGSSGLKIMFYMIAAKPHIHSQNLQNSWQMPPFDYPKQYGPKSPSFARATLLDAATQDAQRLFISGTASIRGHETVHEDSLERQIATTMENIAHLISSDNLHLNSAGAHSFALDRLENVLVYVRNPDDIPLVKTRLIHDWGLDEKQCFFVQADVCRKGLLLEIEASI